MRSSSPLLSTFSPTAVAALVAVAAMLIAAAPAQAGGSGISYLALGDSYGYGYETVNSPAPAGATTTLPVQLGGGSNGDQGYVGDLATLLGLSPGQVLNLSRPGETTTSFSTPGAGPESPFVFNTNYAAGGFTQSQQELFDSLFPNPAAGAGVQYITVSLGGNDVLGLFNNPGFFAQSIPTQEAQITAAVSTFATNDAAILAGVRSEFPDAEILVVGYPDAFAGLDASTLINEGVSPLALPLVQGDAAFGTTEANAAFENLAALPDVDGRFVDLSTPFAGNEANWTLINTIDEGSGTPDYHPNNVGYQEIADDVFSVATTPEPGSLSLALAAGAAGIAAAVSRRRRRAA